MSTAAQIRTRLIETLKTEGTLVGRRPENTITALDAKNPATMQAARILKDQKHARGVRWFAPAAYQSVLP
ncbi:hypothetical protein ACEN9F_13540 [Duganella sp. CT11-25]|uniref:hypothetical protein n=1 Tax=unclassified Duganella TaxID=2636909 RepID=UPI0039B0D137